jgi:large subunit ribosomal protein L9
MDIILLEKVRKLGGIGDKVHVKPGYARNFLIPNKKAVFATESNIAMVAVKRVELEKVANVALQEAQERAEKLQLLEVQIVVQASDEGKLYGSIGVRELAEAITGAGIEVAKQEVRLPEGPLHYIGNYEIALQLHSDVTAVVKVAVISENAAGSQ